MPDKQGGAATPPLVAHLIYSLDFGGLENGLVNLINHMPGDVCRHVIICLTTYSDFAKRIQRPDVPIHALNKPPGKAIGSYLKLWRLLRQLKPDLLHTRNLAALEGQFWAVLAGIPHRIHSEHGRDADDIDGTNLKYQRLRRLFRPFVQHQIALSRDLQRYLADRVFVPPHALSQIYNGVDDTRFVPSPEGRADVVDSPFNGRDDLLVIGTVGRLQPVKDQVNLADAFGRLIASNPQYRSFVRLAIIGDGGTRDKVLSKLEGSGVADLTWLPGARHDVSDLMRAFDVFALPSLAEGISNTILEAMSCGLPVVATDVGGNAELIEHGHTGLLVPKADPAALAEALNRYVVDASLRRAHGLAGRLRIEREFSLTRMVEKYSDIYRRALQGAL
ncbi:sugar transferase (PEP-CTERM/EpsH1 system associated) [Chitinivorax tropicus]|uniref:Sugar transferase (PEP-CTERM/EpsH1 system associated) n=1 Tax=Chitinivorax tropicus TaxID=714531 RepID=A0A840MI51_9PROT|nr:TIGR03088 family PEP-CTERM/XrtA system glycosyltransferase [Chitinivorax tropicus]MBB5018884.1 sugar transferase (PEP-CTERM/EpsH1 system associated) [Chitinivorax tropicus]